MAFETAQESAFEYYKRYVNRVYVTATATTAAAVTTATLPAVAGKTLYILGFSVTGLGATVGLGVAVTVTGLITGTGTYSYSAQTGVTLSNEPLQLSFGDVGIPASAVNTAIAVSCPTLGVGNTANSVNVWGYYI